MITFEYNIIPGDSSAGVTALGNWMAEHNGILEFKRWDILYHRIVSIYIVTLDNESVTAFRLKFGTSHV